MIYGYAPVSTDGASVRAQVARPTDEAGALSQRVIWPFGLAYFDAARVVLAWCELRQDFRHFRTDRMKALTIGGKYPRRRADLMLDWKRDAMSKPRRG